MMLAFELRVSNMKPTYTSVQFTLVLSAVSLCTLSGVWLLSSKPIVTAAAFYSAVFFPNACLE